MTHPRASCLLVLIALAAGGLGPAAQTQTPTWPREAEDAAAPRPDPPARGLIELIGEYEGPPTRGGGARPHLYLLERGGSLWSIVDRGAATPATVQPTRNQAGRVTGVTLGGISYTRLQVGPEGDSGQLRVAPLRPVATVLREARALAPPTESGTFRPADLVELVTLDPTIKLDVRYATTNNFLGSVFYSQARAFLQRPAAAAVARVHRALRPLGYGLLVHDGYRPWFVTKTFWDTTPAEQKWLVANPASGSKHNRGAAVDLTLYDLASGRVVEMPSTYDESTPRAYAFYPGGTARQRWHRALLRRFMEKEGFAVNPEEWWHFDHDDWRSYALGNQPFEQIK